MNTQHVLLLLANAGIFAHVDGSHLHLTCEGSIPHWLMRLGREYKPMLMAAFIRAEEGLTKSVAIDEYRELIYCIALLDAGIDPTLFYQAVKILQTQRK